MEQIIITNNDTTFFKEVIFAFFYDFACRLTSFLGIVKEIPNIWIKEEST